LGGGLVFRLYTKTMRTPEARGQAVGAAKTV
jgi:hypothetical protein